MFTSILVPLDGSVTAERALPYAATIAERTRAALELVHVHLPHWPGEALEALTPYQWEHIVEFDDAANRAAEESEWARLRELAGELGGRYGIRVVPRLLSGPVVPAVTEHARASGASLIVAATHGHTGFRHAWLGGTSDALVRHASVPLMLVRPREGSDPPPAVPFRRMLLPLDGSPFSASIVPAALELAYLLGMRVTLLEVVDAGGHPVRPFPALRSQAEANSYLHDLVARFPGHLPRPETRIVVHAFPAVAILDELEGAGFDLVAMATHGRGGLRHLVIGSTADKVMRGTDVPVLLFRPHGGLHSADAVQQAEVSLY